MKQILCVNVILLVSFVVLMSLVPCSVRGQDITRFEVEVAIGPNFGKKKVEGCNIREGIDIILEARCNYSSHFDFGLQFLVGAYDLLYKGRGVEETYRNMILQPVVDYNFRMSKHVSSFVGGGLGMAIVDVDLGYNQFNSICFTPRLGVELFKHLRMTLDYRLLKWDLSFWNCSVGFVLGGGNKTRRHH